MAVSFETPITGRQTLEHFMGAVVTCKDFLTLIQKRQDLSAAQALKDLQAYVQKEKDLLNLGEGVGYGGTDPKLIEVYLQKRSWETIPQTTQRHLIKHMRQKTFRTLYLRNATRLRWNDFKTFDLTQLTFLDVSGCPFVDDRFMSDVSKNCSVLGTLDISRTAVTGVQDQGIFSVKPFQGTFLTTLKAIECPDLKTLNIEAPNLIYLDIPSLGFTSVNLEDPVLDFSKYKILERELSILFSFKNITNIRSLNLKNNNINNKWVFSLGTLTGLTSLNLWNNGIGDRGAASLSSLTGLTSLNLGENGIGATGAASLSPLTGLTSLDLGYNGIGDKGAAFLSTLTNLTSLNLDNVGISEEVQNTLCKKLPHLKDKSF